MMPSSGWMIIYIAIGSTPMLMAAWIAPKIQDWLKRNGWKDSGEGN